MFRRCPSCKRLFQAESVKSEQRGSYEVQGEGFRGNPKVEHVENFRVTYKCKSCSYEWTGVSEKTLHDHLYLHKP